MINITKDEFDAWTTFKLTKKPLNELTLNDFAKKDEKKQSKETTVLSLEQQKELIQTHEERLQELHQSCLEGDRKVLYCRLGCFFCGHQISQDINPFIKRQKVHKTLLCPYCKVDSVVDLSAYNSLNHSQLLENMSHRWFSKWSPGVLLSLRKD